MHDLGVEVGSSEHCFHYQKAQHFGDFHRAQEILNAPSPAEAKAIGGQVEAFAKEEWDRVKYNYMHRTLLAKFGSSEDLRRQLLSTGTKRLIEASPYDSVWGVGQRSGNITSSMDLPGQNLLGRCLESVRHILRQPPHRWDHWAHQTKHLPRR